MLRICAWGEAKGKEVWSGDSGVTKERGVTERVRVPSVGLSVLGCIRLISLSFQHYIYIYTEYDHCKCSTTPLNIYTIN